MLINCSCWSDSGRFVFNKKNNKNNILVDLIFFAWLIMLFVGSVWFIVCHMDMASMVDWVVQTNHLISYLLLIQVSPVTSWGVSWSCMEPHIRLLLLVMYHHDMNFIIDCAIHIFEYVKSKMVVKLCLRRTFFISWPKLLCITILQQRS